MNDDDDDDDDDEALFGGGGGGGGGYVCPPSEFQILSCRNFGRSLRRCRKSVHCRSEISNAAPKF